MKKIGLALLMVSLVWVGILIFLCADLRDRSLLEGAVKAERVRLLISQTRFNHHEGNAIAGAEFIEAALEYALHVGERDLPIDAALLRRALDLHLDAFAQSYEPSVVTGSREGFTIIGKEGEVTYRVFRHNGFKQLFPVGTPSREVIEALANYAVGLSREKT